MECKAKLNRNDAAGWLKTIAGFSNAVGGVMYIGVEDKTNKLIGFDRKEADNERNYLNNQINQHLSPRPQIKISFQRYKIRENERYVIRVSVSESPLKPVVLKIDGVPSIYMRRDGFTSGASYEEIREMAIRTTDKQYDELASDIPFDFSDFKQLRSYYSQKNNGMELNEKKLASMSFFDEKHILKNGAVLFMDGYEGNKTLIHCSMFAGFNRGSDRLVTLNRFQGNIISCIEYVLDFVNVRMNHGIIKRDSERENIPAYPYRALFEAVVNAIVHRDYYLDGTQIQVEMFRDRLEISSPGGFYKGEKFGKTYDLTKIISKRRNELIASVLVSCNVMEAAGTGFDKILQEYSGADEPHKPYVYSTTDHFTLVLPDLTYQNGVRDDRIPEIQFIPVPNGSDKDEQILAYCYTTARKSSEIANFLGISLSSYFRNNILDNLVKNEYLIKSKTGRMFYYKTNRDLVSLA